MRQLITENRNSVFIVSADFAKCNFERLQAEYKQKGFISWEVTGKGSQKCAAGDICYIYWFNLPSASGESQARILLRGVVKESVKDMTLHEIYGNNDPAVVRGFSMTDLQPIELTDYRKYCYANLISKYNITSLRPSIQMLWENQAQLYMDIENNLKQAKKQGFSDLIKYFEVPCVFQNVLHPKSAPLTFRRRSTGLLYYEKHHFVQQNTVNKINDPEFYKIVYHPENIMNLCPYCHRRIHLSTPEDVEKMVAILYREKKDFYDEMELNKYVGSDVLGWLKKLYLVNNESSDSVLTLPNDTLE